MPLLLAIETSSDICSVAIGTEQQVLSVLSDESPNSHSTKLSLLTRQLFSNSGISMKDIDAVALSAGPGSFTGLRIGASFAKGICFGLQKPLIAVDTLYTLAFLSGIRLTENNLLCVITDAGINEAYYSVFDHSLRQVFPTSLSFVNQEIFKTFPPAEKYLITGYKTAKWTEFARDLPWIEVLPETKPNAGGLINIAQEKFNQKKFEDLSSFEPVYLRDFKAKDFSAKIRKILYSE